MKRRILVWLILIVCISITVAIFWRSGISDYGYVLITNGEWTFENTLSRSVLIALIPALLLYATVRILLSTWRLPRLWGEYRHKRKAERARKNIIHGLIELTEGHWQKAERVLLQDIDNSETPLLNYLLAARAAQQQDADDRRDQYLKQAHTVTPEADIAIGLTQAELQLAHEQTEQALASLSRLRELAPKHPYVLKLLSRLYTQLNEWEKLTALLPELRKQRIVSGDKLLRLERKVYTEWLRYVVANKTKYDLEEQWKSLPKRYRDDQEIFRVYVQCLRSTQQDLTAERVLRGFLNKQWDEDLVRYYGELSTANTRQQLDQAEAWLKQHPHSAMLLLALARLSARLKLWGKAKGYYEASIGIQPSVAAYAELAGLVETLEEHATAHEYYRKGLALATGRAGAVAVESDITN